MCARFTLHSSSQEVRELFGLDDDPAFEPRYNIAPTQEILIVAESKQGQRKARSARWGLVPNWAKDPSIGSKLINAKSETLSEKPSFREAIRKRRCLIPADGFYEWADGPIQGKSGKPSRQPYRIVVDDGRPFAFAGLYDYWFSPHGSEPLLSATIVTTEPNQVVRPLHDRMPVIVDPSMFKQWLDRDAPTAAIQEVLRRVFPAERMSAYAVSQNVNRATYEEADCIAPLAQ